MKRPPDTAELKHVIVTLFEKDGDPWIQLKFVAKDGSESVVSTELDCREFRIRFNTDDEEECDALAPWFGDPTKKTGKPS